MKKGLIIGIIVFLLLITLVPIPTKIKDGGTVKYNAILYQVSQINSYSSQGHILGCNQGTVVKVLGIKIFDNVQFVPNQTPSYAYLEAMVLEVGDTHILVAPRENKSVDYDNLIQVSSRNIADSENLLVGDIVKIKYDGLILESYPSQITTVYGFEIIQKQELVNITSTSVAYVNWSDSPAISENAINRQTLKNAPHELPVFKLDSFDELGDFKQTFGNIFQMNSTYDEMPSFDEITRSFDEPFFNENILLLVYVPASSGSDRFALGKVIGSDSSLCIYIDMLDTTDMGTCDMAGWIVAVAINRNSTQNYTSFTARL